MQIDDESRKQLAKFWRRKLWLGIAAIGTLGIAAWRISSVQARYDDVLVQESRNLPDKVYQELIQEIRQGIPNQPIFWETDDFKKNQTCSSINLLVSLGDRRAIPELKKLMEDEMNHVKNCGNAGARELIQDSIYLEAASALSKFQDDEIFTYLRQSLTQLPSLRILNLQREFHRRYQLRFTTNSSYDKDVTAVLNSPFPRFLSSSEYEGTNQKIIRSLQVPAVVSQAHIQKRQKLEGELSNQQTRDKAIEALFVDYFAQSLFETKQRSLRQIVENRAKKGDRKAFERLMSSAPKFNKTLTQLEQERRSLFLASLRELSSNPQFRPAILAFLKSHNFRTDEFLMFTVLLLQLIKQAKLRLIF